jgi:hypothetical protein
MLELHNFFLTGGTCVEIVGYISIFSFILIQV